MNKHCVISIRGYFILSMDGNMKQNIKIIFLHGNHNSTPNDIWFPYLKLELEKLGCNVVSRQFPDADLARASYWLPFLKNELDADEYSILVGHSSGAIAAMRFAQENKLLGSILVGSYHTDLDIEKEKLSGYFEKPWDWDAIKNNQQWIVQFASIDDPWIPIAEPRFVREKLKSEYYEYDNKGHFGGDYYKSTFPELLDVLKNKLSFGVSLIG